MLYKKILKIAEECDDNACNGKFLTLRIGPYGRYDTTLLYHIPKDSEEYIETKAALAEMDD